MDNEIEIILRAIDDASSTFSDVTSSASEMGDNISDAAESAGDGFEDMESSVEDAASAIDGVDPGSIDDVATSAEEAGSSADDASSSLEDVASSADSVTGDGLESAAEAADHLAESSEGANEELEKLNELTGMQGAQMLMDSYSGLNDELWNCVDSAGKYGDSMNRAELEAQGAGISIDAMKSSFSELSAETGRAGSSIRESFITATARGVTDLGAFNTMMKGASAQAYLLNMDVEAVSNQFTKMAAKSKVSERQLANTGITVDELGQALGIQGATIDDVNAKWETMDTNARAAALGQAASMNEAKDANNAYKDSWAGLQAQIDIGKGRIERLVGDVLLPVLIPAFEAASNILSAFGDALSAVMSSPIGGFVSVLGALAAGLMLVVPAIAAVTAAMPFLTGTLYPAIAASWALIAPWLPWIALAALIVAAIYEIGKAFGWWSDASSMIEAISAGLQRLWDAFINHPDVQAAIQAITSGLQWLWQEVQKAGQAVMEFFGITNDGSFDIVRALIDTVGAAWNMMRTNIMNVVTVCMMLWNATEPLRNVLIEIGGYLLGEFMAALNTVAQIFGVIWNGVSQLVNIFQQFQDGQISLPGLLIGIWSTLNTMFAQVLSLIIQNAARWASQLISWAVQAGSGFVSNIISFISQLPWRVLAFLTTVLVYVVQKTTQWVNTARSKASQLVSQVVSFLSQLPGRALSALLGVVSAIVSAGSQWVSNARSKASQVVSGVVGALSGLPGRVASAVSGVVSAIVSPFQTAYSRVMSWVNKIKSAASSVLHLAAGGEDFLAAGGEDLLTGETFDITSGKTIDVDGSIDINLNVDGLPEGVSDDQVSQIFEEMINDPDFKDELIRQIVGSKLFQRLDTKEKNRLLRINNRAKGV